MAEKNRGVEILERLEKTLESIDKKMGPQTPNAGPLPAGGPPEKKDETGGIEGRYSPLEALVDMFRRLIPGMGNDGTTAAGRSAQNDPLTTGSPTPGGPIGTIIRLLGGIYNLMNKGQQQVATASPASPLSKGTPGLPPPSTGAPASKLPTPALPPPSTGSPELLPTPTALPPPSTGAPDLLPTPGPAGGPSYPSNPLVPPAPGTVGGANLPLPEDPDLLNVGRRDVLKAPGDKTPFRASRTLRGAAKGFNLMAGKANKAGMPEQGDKLAKMADLAQTGARAAAGDPTAIMKLMVEVKKKIDEKMEHAKAVGGEVFRGFASEKAGDIGAHFGKAGEHMGELLPGPAGDVVGGMAKIARVASESVEKLRSWNNHLHNSNMQFAEFSAAMSQVQASQEMRDFFYAEQRGNKRADTASDLAQAKSRLDRQLAPIEDFFANLRNKVTAWGTDKLSFLLEKAGLGGGEPDDKDAIHANEWMFEMGKEGWAEYYGRPARFRGDDPFKLDKG